MAGNYFLGASFTQDVNDDLEYIQSHIPREAGIEFTHRENFHLTIRFLGKSADGISEISSQIKGPYSLSLTGFGTFKGARAHNRDKHGVLYVAGIACTRLHSLAKPNWVPHITLAKGKGVNFSHLEALEYLFHTEEPVKVDLVKINLYRTVGNGKPYEVMESWAV